MRGAANIAEFVGLLRRPRAVMMLVPAGPPVDSVIADLLPHLKTGDLIIDAGNSHFNDTDLRPASWPAKGIHFLGVGVSGGEEGARHGPSIMPGGPKEAYERVRPVLEAVAAKVNGDPCVTYLGPGSAGHFVKMVHNGIEYGADAADRRDLRPDEARPGLERRRTARRLRRVEQGRAERLSDGDHQPDFLQGRRDRPASG